MVVTEPGIPATLTGLMVTGQKVTITPSLATLPLNLSILTMLSEENAELTTNRSIKEPRSPDFTLHNGVTRRP